MRYSKMWLSCFLIVIMLICSVDIGFAVNEDISNSVNMSEEDELALENGFSKSVSNSEKSKINVLEDIETEPSETDSEQSEETLDNWELGLVFYDSTVDSGKTPLTEINWDASDGGYGTGESRVITVQINYKNTNTVKTYQPGDLKIKIDGLLKEATIEMGKTIILKDFDASFAVGANDSTHTGYDWNASIKYVKKYISGVGYKNGPIDNIIFTNAITIEEKTNLEGSIQIIYNITPKSENPERFEDICIHSFNTDLQAMLNDNTHSNIAHFKYKRTYSHKWEQLIYNVRKTASIPMSLDNIADSVDNANDYYWIKYNLNYNQNQTQYSISYPYIKAENMVFKDAIPNNCIVLDEKGQKLISDNDVYAIPAKSWINDNQYIYVANPKNIYKDDNLIISNTVELFGTYENETEEKLLGTAITTINLAEFEFKYNGDL